MTRPPWEAPLARRLLPFALLALATLGLVAARGRLDKAHIVLVYLVVVLVGSAAAGRTVGLLLTFGSFLAFNFFLLEPYHTLRIADARDWLVLLALLVTSVIAAQLMDLARRGAEEARRRAEEIDRLSLLGAESLSAGRAEEAVAALARVLRSTLDLAACEVHVWDSRTETLQRVARAARDGWGPEPHPAASRPARESSAPDPLLAVVAQRGLCAAHRVDGTSRLIESGSRGLSEGVLLEPDLRVIVAPLLVRDRLVGALRLVGDPAIRLDAPERRFAVALSRYAALGAERVRLVAESERAEALREADRLKDALIASVSHDLRTPLTTIKALAHDLRKAGAPEAAVIEEEADRLNRFVSDLLDLSRLEAGGLPVTPELIAAEDLLGAALQRVSGIPRGSEIEAHLDGAAILVGRLDFVHALHALVNLLENALKHSPAGAPVQVAVARQGDRLAFRVEDHGTGVPPDQRERIFDPFFRSDDAIARTAGLGLGLAIARGLARAQGGDVEYAPRGAGGSTFTLFLPAADIRDSLSTPPGAGIQKSPPVSPPADRARRGSS